MKALKFIYEYKFIILPIFLFIGVIYDFVHIHFNMYKQEYRILEYGVEINFSIIFYKLKSLIKGVIQWIV
jgi:hypothetical protein